MRWPIAAIGLAAGYDDPPWWGGSGNPFVEAAPPRALSDPQGTAVDENPVDMGELAVLTGQADPVSFASAPDGCGSNPIVYMKVWQSQFLDGCWGIVAILNTKFGNHQHPEYDANWRIDPADPDALWRLARRTMTAPGRVSYSVTQFDVGLRISKAMFGEMKRDALNAADALAEAVTSTLAFAPGFVRVAGTSPDLGAVGAFGIGRRLSDVQNASSSSARRLAGHEQQLAVFYEVLTESVNIPETLKELDNFKSQTAMADSYRDRVAQFAQSMVLTCTVNCSEVFAATVDPTNSGFPTQPYDPFAYYYRTYGGYGDYYYESDHDHGGAYPLPYFSYSSPGGYSYGAQNYFSYTYYNSCYTGCLSCDQSGPEDCTSCTDGSTVIDADGDGYGSCSSYSSGNSGYGVSTYYSGNSGYGNRLRRLQYNMFSTNDVVSFVEFHKDGAKKTGDRSALFNEYLFDKDGGDYHFWAVDALSEDAAMAWYQVGGCPAKGELYTDFPGDHPYNDLKGFCLQECCGCKICEDYYAGISASNQSILLEEMEAFCKTHERSCMNGECSMCGPCFAMCSYDESEIASEAKAFLTFVSAAKEPDPTLCKMCCHMDMNAQKAVWDGIAQCPEDSKAKAREEMKCDNWDWEVSCTCEKDMWREVEGNDNYMPAVDQSSRDNAEFCKNAVTYWVSVYHCNDVFLSLSRDQPAFRSTVENAGLQDYVDMLPTEDWEEPSLCDICGATCAFNFEGACRCPIATGPPPDEKYAMFIFCGVVGGLLFIQFYDFCVPRPVA
jgi:hypothetical protein